MNAKNRNMKRITLFALLGIAIMLSCTREELNVVDKPVTINENSPSFQSYLEERAISFIKIYRFDKVKEILDRITDQTIKENIMSVYNEYKSKADREALFYVNAANDTLFFLVPSETEPDPSTRTWLYLINEKANIPKTKGILSGFSKFPKLQTFIISYALAEEVHELEYLPDLERFDWSQNEDFFKRHFPNEQYGPVQLVADFSENNKLKTITLKDMDIENLTFPDSEIDLFKLEGLISRYNSNDVLHSLKAKEVEINGKSARNPFVLKNEGIQSLKISSTYDTSFGFTSLDVSESGLESLTLAGDGGTFVTEMKFNDGLKRLSFKAEGLKEKPSFPISLESLSLANYRLSDLDFSHLINLKSFTFSQSGIIHSIDNSKLHLPSGLEYLKYSAFESHQKLDISYLHKLRKVTLSGTNDIDLPPNIEEIDISYISGILDLNDFDKLKRIRVYTASNFGILEEIIFPPNLTEDEIHDPSNNFYSAIFITRQCKLTNMPEWMNKYIHYQD